MSEEAPKRIQQKFTNFCSEIENLLENGTPQEIRNFVRIYRLNGDVISFLIQLEKTTASRMDLHVPATELMTRWIEENKAIVMTSPSFFNITTNIFRNLHIKSPLADQSPIDQSPFIPLSENFRFIITSYSIDLLAEHLTMVDRNLFLKISTDDILAYIESKRSANSASLQSPLFHPPSPLHSFLHRSFIISKWVAMTIMQCDDRSRTILLSNFIQILIKLYKMKNYHTMSSIFSGLNKVAIQRLSSLWAKTKSQEISNLEKIDDLLSPNANFNRYRVHIASRLRRKKKIFPIIEILLNDIINNEISSNTPREVIQNFHSLILQFHFETNTELTNQILQISQLQIEDDQILALSYQIEPFHDPMVNQSFDDQIDQLNNKKNKKNKKNDNNNNFNDNNNIIDEFLVFSEDSFTYIETVSDSYSTYDLSEINDDFDDDDADFLNDQNNNFNNNNNNMNNNNIIHSNSNNNINNIINNNSVKSKSNQSDYKSNFLIKTKKMREISLFANHRGSSDPPSFSSPSNNNLNNNINKNNNNNNNNIIKSKGRGGRGGVGMGLYGAQSPKPSPSSDHLPPPVKISLGMVNKYGYTLVCKKKDLPSDRKGMKVKVNKVSVAIFRVDTSGQSEPNYYALPDRCPHKDIPLHDGKIEYNSKGRITVACPGHNFKFDLENGMCYTSKKYSIASAIIKIKGENVWVKLRSNPPPS